MGKVTFNNQWLEHPEYKEWVRRDTDKYKAYCFICKKSFELGKMGLRALTLHHGGKKHASLLKANKPAVPLGSFFAHSTTEKERRDDSHVSASAIPCTVNSTRVVSAPTMTSYTRTDVLTAEILWTLKVVSSHYSFKSCEENNKVFQTMFPDSDIAKDYKCGERKTAYLATFGIAPYFFSQLKNSVKSESAYVLLFDESLNHDLQEKQLDVHVRVWEEGQVRTIYLVSEFLGHATASDLLDRLDPVVCELGHRKLLQISMDGPNVNWKLYRSIQDEIEKQSACKMLQTGSCGLHITHNAFHSGCEAAQWDMEGLLSSLYYLFHDAPARREDFTTVTGSTTLPLMFCKHRWLENIKAAERAILLMPQIVEYCTAAQSKRVTCPTNNSFSVVKKAIQDPLLTAKLQFFLTISSDVEPFLKLYQTDKPMIPFIVQDLGLLVKGLMERFIKPQVLEEKASSVTGMVKVDVRDRENWVDLSKVDVGFPATRTLLKNNLASDRQRGDFRSGCRNFLVAMVKKLLEKAPITYPLVRYLSWLDPRQIAKAEEKDNNTKKLRRTLNIMVENKRIQESSCDHILRQYSRLMESLQQDGETRARFVDFDPSEDDHRVDTLFHSYLASDKQYADLWPVVKQLLLLSHGQASVERGFSVNKEVSVENLSKESLVARRQIVQNVHKHGGAHCVPITKELILSASAARSKYQDYLEKARKEEAATKAGQKRTAALDDVASLKAKKARLEQDIDNLVQQADKLCEEAEEKETLTLVSQANALRNKARDKKKNVADLEVEIEQKMTDMKDSQ